MPEGNRPFVDRRMAALVLFEGSNKDFDPETLRTAYNNNIEVSNLRSADATKAAGSSNPPQVKLYFRDSGYSLSSLQTMDQTIRDAFQSQLSGYDGHSNMRIAELEFFAGAISPGGKVRNAFSIPSFD